MDGMLWRRGGSEAIGRWVTQRRKRSFLRRSIVLRLAVAVSSSREQLLICTNSRTRTQNTHTHTRTPLTTPTHTRLDERSERRAEKKAARKKKAKKKRDKDKPKRARSAYTFFVAENRSRIVAQVCLVCVQWIAMEYK